MKLIQMIIVSSTYLTIAFVIMIFIQGFIYQAFRFSIYNWIADLVHKLLYETVEITINRRKLRYTKIKEYRKVG